MKIENLTVGTTYKNWKALCEALEVEPKSGSYKQKQERDFKQYFNWEKQGQKITVTEIYNEVQEREDKRKDNGKSEASKQALEQHRSHRPSFFDEDELQLAILWTLGTKYYESIRNEDASLIFIPKNEMHIQLGLCNEFFNTLYRNRYYYCKLDKHDKRETGIDMWKVKTAFDLYNKYSNIDSDMQRQVITAFNQLQRKKVLEFCYWKAWSNGMKEQLFTDEQMKLFLAIREETLTWWNEEHKARVCETVGEIYGKLIPKEIKAFEEEFKNRLNKTKDFKGLKYYFSCYKTVFAISSIKRELKKRGFEVGVNSTDFNRAYIENMTHTVIKINSKFIQRHIERIDNLRDEQLARLEQYETELENYYKQLESQPKRVLGKRVAKEPKQPNISLTECSEYSDVLDILFLGLKLIQELTDEQRQFMQGVEHCIEVNKNEEEVEC